MQRLIIGTYPAGETAGSGEGLWEVFLDPRSGELTQARQLVETPSPSFVALHPDGRTLFAVSETEDGAVTAFSLTDDAVEERGSRSTFGAHPCHVVAREDQVWVTNYTSGTFTVLGLDAAADFTDAVQSFGHTGTGPDAGRQEGPHAHFCLSAPSVPGAAEVSGGAWVVDLGTDEIRGYVRGGGSDGPGADSRAGRGASLVDGGVAATLPAGSGPRHAAVHPDGTVFVVGELDSRVHLLRPAAGADAGPGARPWEAYASVPACVTADPGTGSYPSHVALNADGSRLYVAVRGPDVLSTFAVGADGTGAVLTHLADTPIGGVWPRHFAVVASESGDLVVVANQNSSNVTVLRIDAAGVGEQVGQLALPAPACVLPV